MATEDVIVPESSPEIPVAQPGPEPVSSDQGPDRPVENAVAEFNRKFARFERHLQDLSTLVAQTASNAKPASEAQPVDVSDDELWRLAQQGDRGAFDVYMQRVAARTSRTELQGERHARLVDSQLVAIAQKYPVLNDISHPLTQTVQTAYQLLLGQGYPAHKATLLEAVKTAIADRPDLVSELYAQTATVQETGRRSATQVARAGQTGAAHRETRPPPSVSTKPLSPAEIALAKRMGVKDPAGAKKRFLERRLRGESNIGQVAGFLNEEDL